MPALSFNSARSAQVRDIISALELSGRNHQFNGPIVLLPFPCAIRSSLFRHRCLPIALRCFRRWLFLLIRNESWWSSSSVSAHAAGGAGSERQQSNTSLHIAASVVKADYQTQSLQVIHCLVLAGWRIIAKYFWLDNATLEHCSWRIKSDSNGVHGPPRYLEKRKRVSSRHMWRLWRDAC